MIKNLSLKWTVSRGRDTYGYNIVTLTDQVAGKKYRTMGGNYDMQGTVFSNWMDDNYRERYKTLADKVSSLGVSSFYGLYVGSDGHMYTDGACGLNCMLRIAKAIGLDCQEVYSRKDGLTNILVEDTQEN